MKINGFTLIELVVAISISSILSISLFLIFYQINRSSRLVEQTISVDMRAVILQGLLEKDISGVFVPKIDEPKKSAASQISPDQQKQTKEQKEPKEKKQELEKTFFYVSSGNMLKEFTFITCNPLQIYGQTKPRMARVSYRVQEKDRGYTLLRRESRNIVFGTEKDAVEYEVVSDIKELVFEFIVPVSQKEKIDFKTFKEWRSPQKIGDQKIIIPQFVKVNVTFWDTPLHTSEQSFEFRYSIYTYIDHLSQQEKGKNIQDTKPEQGKLNIGGPSSGKV